MHLSDYFGKTINEVKQYTKNVIQLKKVNLKTQLRIGFPLSQVQ